MFFYCDHLKTTVSCAIFLGGRIFIRHHYVHTPSHHIVGFQCGPLPTKPPSLCHVNNLELSNRPSIGISGSAVLVVVSRLSLNIIKMVPLPFINFFGLHYVLIRPWIIFKFCSHFIIIIFKIVVLDSFFSMNSVVDTADSLPILSFLCLHFIHS